MSDLIDNRKDAYAILLRFGNTYNASKSGEYGKVSETENKIIERAQQKLNEKYGDVVRSGMHLILYQQVGTNGEYYFYAYSSLSYREGHDVEVPYTIHYVCNGKEIKTDTGVSERNGSISFEVPENYKFSSCKLRKGNGSAGRTQITVKGRDAIEATVELEVNDPTMVSYWITYRDTKGNVLDEVVGKGKIGGTVTPEKKSFDGYELAYTSEIKAHTLKSVNSQNMFTVTYAKLTDYRIVYHCTVDGEDQADTGVRYLDAPWREDYRLADGWENYTCWLKKDNMTFRIPCVKVE